MSILKGYDQTPIMHEKALHSSYTEEWNEAMNEDILSFHKTHVGDDNSLKRKDIDHV